MKLVDTHAHIYLNEFDDDRLSVIERARKAGVEKILLPAIDSTTHLAMLNLEKDYPGYCFSMIGLHPCSVSQTWLEEVKLLKNYLEKRKFVAVGEIGLDFYWDLSYKEQQFAAFRKQIDLAIEYNLPIVIHSRNATDECIGVVREFQDTSLKGVFHCFSGTAEQARQITNLGFYLGIGGVLTFKNAGLDKVIQEIDLEHLLLETDAPYLAPAPFRGKRNEPGYVRYVTQKLADIKEVAIEVVAEVTSNNAQKLFNL